MPIKRALFERICHCETKLRWGCFADFHVIVHLVFKWKMTKKLVLRRAGVGACKKQLSVVLLKSMR